MCYSDIVHSFDVKTRLVLWNAKASLVVHITHDAILVVQILNVQTLWKYSMLTPEQVIIHLSMPLLLSGLCNHHLS